MRLTTKKLKLINRSAAALLALSGGSIGTVQAQVAPPVKPIAVDESNVVVVTARRREETLQDVPVSVTAFTGEQLSKQGIPDITALSFALPNTTLKASRATSSTLTAFIRGVGQQDPLAGFEAGVGIYLDDIYLARPQGAITDIYDVERIEVLRGPQGTLYGRNTIGGAVKYVTRKLSKDTEFRVKGVLGNYDQRELVLTASTPITDTARIGGSIAKFRRDGFGTNLTTGQENYNKDVTAARLSAEFMPTPDLFIRLAADVTEDDSNPRNGHRLTVGRTGGAPILANEFDTRAGLTTVLGKEQEITAHGMSAIIEYQINNELMVKSVTASRKDRSYAPIDFDALAVVDFEVPALYENKQFSQEFQFTYTGDKLAGVAGVYYIDANAFNKFDAILAGVFPASVYTEGDIDTKAWAVFADASYQLNDRWELSLGGRYTVDQRDASILRQLYFGTNGTPAMGNPNAVLFRTDTDFTGANKLEREDNKFTPKVGVAFKASEDQNIYASWARGFKGGGFDPRMNVVGTRISPAQAREGYLPETIDTLELGLKSAYNNGRILTNIAAFTSDYKNVQIPGSVAVDTNNDGVDDSFAGVTTNAGEADILGFELEASGRLTDALTLSGMYSYIDAEYTRFIVGGVNLAPQRVFQNTPVHSANLRGNYDIPMPLMGTDGTATISTSVSYKDKTFQFETASVLDQEAYTIWDLSLLWSSKDGKIRAGLHGKNLTDERYITGGYLFPTLGNEGVVTAFYGNPRTVQATLEYRF